MNDVLAWISLVVGIVSIVIAVFAIILSSKSEKAVTENLNATKEMIRNFEQDRKQFESSMQYFLTEMGKKTERIEEISRVTKEDVHDTVKRVFESQFPSQDEAFRNQIMGSVLSNPQGLDEFVKTIPELQKAVENLRK